MCNSEEENQLYFMTFGFRDECVLFVGIICWFYYKQSTLVQAARNSQNIRDIQDHIYSTDIYRYRYIYIENNYVYGHILKTKLDIEPE